MYSVHMRYIKPGHVVSLTPIRSTWMRHPAHTLFRIEDSVLRDAYWSHPPTAVRAPVKRSIPVLLTA